MVGKHFATLVENDTQIANRVSSICVGVNSWSNDFKGAVEAGFGTLAGGIGAACSNVETLANDTTGALASLSAQALTAFSNLTDEITETLEGIVAAINAILGPCCEAEIDPGTEIIGPAHGFSTPGVSAGPCGLGTFSPIPEFPCSFCQQIPINAPCSNNEGPFQVGFTCDGGSDNKPDYEDVGDCGVG